jgi:Mitochondrial carrier protein
MGPLALRKQPWVQIAGRSRVTADLTTWEVVQRVYRQEGVAGFWRGLPPRLVNVAMWGTCMVTAYEFLKRLCVVDDLLPER